MSPAVWAAHTANLSMGGMSCGETSNWASRSITPSASATFFVTIIFSFIYWIHYEFGGGQTQRAELAADLARIEAIKAAAPATEDSDDVYARLLADAAVGESGGAVFAGKCAACHGNELQGLIGPNLTDEFWIHGKGTPKDIAAVVRKGVLDKGMPPWEGQLKDDEIRAVTVFIASRAGTKPPNPKPPQGEKVVRN